MGDTTDPFQTTDPLDLPTTTEEATTTTTTTTTTEPTTTTTTDPKNPGSTAIAGRTERAISLIRYRMKGDQYIFGVSDTVGDITFNVPGFFNAMYRYGIIGVLLSYAFYVCCALFGKGFSRWAAIIILVTSFFSAHTHGTFYMLFYVLMLMDGVARKSNKPKHDLPSGGEHE